MQKALLLLLIATCVAIPAQAGTIRTFKPLAPMQIPTIKQQASGMYNENMANPTENYPKITILEENLFKRSYERENIYKRLTRIENKIFRRDFTTLPLANRVDNIFDNIDTGIMHGIKSTNLAKLESKVLGRVYPNDDSESRITRLEKEMLGAMQGGNLKERFETIKSASKHYNSFPEIVNNQIPYQMPMYSPYGGYAPTYNHNNGWNSNWTTTNNNWNTNPSYGVRNILKNMARNVFGGGMLTGFTPPVYDTYNPYSIHPSTGQQEYCWGNTGGYIRNRSVGGGSTVRILD